MTSAEKVCHAASAILSTNLHAFNLARGACRNGANQKWSELSQLIHLLRPRRLETILEIGIDRGGTMALWAQLAATDAHLVGIDITISPEAKDLIEARLMPKQSLSLLETDSHAASVRQKLIELTAGRAFDFLFIDGDHSYQGVKQDFDYYSPLLRGGGVVAFHDIVPDYGSRFGMRTNHDSGGVHQFWREVSSLFQSYAFIEDPEQNGYGIGVLFI